MGPNVWPPVSLIPENAFKTVMLEYYQKMHALSLIVLEILARGLPYGKDIFDEFVSNDAVAAIRLLHYPPQTSTDELQLGAGAHTDFGAITLLLQDQNSGLQVLNEQVDDWIPIAPNDKAYVVNVGDMLSKWTSGLYKSNLHRVVNKSTKERFSVPFFFDGNLDCPLAPFDGSKVEGGVITVEDHMKERFATTYGRVIKT
jgi:isopenicillin N synthase-like dioxygenase